MAGGEYRRGETMPLEERHLIARLPQRTKKTRNDGIRGVPCWRFWYSDDAMMTVVMTVANTGTLTGVSVAHLIRLSSQCGGWWPSRARL